MASLSVFLRSWIVGFCVEAILYGLELTFFASSLAFLTVLRRSSAVNYPMLIMTCLLFAGSTSHFAHDIYGCVSSFAAKTPTVGQAHFLLATNIMFSINNAIGDLVLVYRCWLVWEKRHIPLILPALLYVTFLVSTILGLYSSARQSNASELGQNAAFVNFGKASFTISLVFNIVVTLLIAGRLFAMIKQTQQFLPRSHARQYWNTIALITESGAIFTATQLAFIILWNLQLSTSSLALPLAQVYCIVPTLIIVRVGLGRSLADQHTNPANTGPSARGGSRTVLESMKFTRSGPTASAADSVTGEAYELEHHKPNDVQARV